ADLARGAVSGPGQFAAQFLLDPTRFYVAARLLSVAAGTLTVLLAVALARRMGVAGGAAWLAGLVVAVTPAHASYSRQAVPDAPALLLTTLALLQTLRAGQEGSPRRLLAAGLLAGLAEAIKYDAWPLLFPALAVAAGEVAGAWGVASGARPGASA